MTFRKAILFSAAAATMAAFASAASAQDDTFKPTATFNVGGSNDYVFRGVSQTNGDMQVFGGADVAAGPLYIGTWLSNVDFGDSTDGEWDVYAGVKPSIGIVGLDLGVIHYGYFGEPDGAGYENWEFKAAASVPAGKGAVGAAVFYSPDGFGAADDSIYYELNASYPVLEKVAVSAVLARQTYEGPGDYTTWNLGATWNFAPHLSVDLRYHDTDHHEFAKAYKARAVVTLKATFP